MFLLLFFFYCLLIPGDKVKSINLSRQPCIRFCLWFFLFFDLLTNRAGITVRVLCLFSCCRRRRRRCCCCCSILSFYVLRCGSGCLLLITCIFTLRFFYKCVRVFHYQNQNRRVRVCVYTKNITDILVYIQERTLYGTSVCM